jgi:quinol monooxygenase YgiN
MGGESGMTGRRFLAAILAGLVFVVLYSGGRATAEPTDTTQDSPAASPLVRIAELEIDPAYVDSYKASLKEEIQTSIRVEPGVLTLYAVSLRDDPTRIRLFETYADLDAYNAHIQSPHFLKYKNDTLQMVRSLTLLETDPILLGAKPTA